MTKITNTSHRGRFGVDLALQESLRFNSKRVSILNSDPKSAMFVTWFHISCYFPILTACLGPIANTISIAGLVEKWRETKVIQDGVQIGVSSVRDPAAIFVLNVISLVLGFASNIVLLLHFSEKLSYLKAQCICILGWTTASFILVIDVIVCGAKYFDEKHERSIGFWYAAITSGLYFGCTITLTTHFIGYFSGKYPARFNLIKKERSLMVFTVLFSIILIWGGGMFSRLLHRSFGTALYFCIVSILTIGFGDIPPSSVASKILILVYSTIGVVTLALIIAMTRGILQESGGAVVFFHRVEVLRSQELIRIKNGEIKYTEEEAFKKIHEIRKIANAKQKIHALLTTLISFVVFWNMGSLVFMFSERWSYFDAVYFGFLCLLTIGYGDYAPVTGAGRAFFVLWALGAIPLMSAILSTVGDVLLDLADTIDTSVAMKFGMRLQSIVLYGNKTWNRFILNNEEILPEGDPENTDDDHDNDNDTGGDTENQTSGGKDQDISLSSNDDSSCNGIPSIRTYLPTNLEELIAEDPTDLPITILNTLQDKISAENPESIYNDRYKNTKLGEMRYLLEAFKKFRAIAKKNKRFSLSFDQWNELRSLFIFSQDNQTLNDPNFWLSDYSPLRFPLDQPRFVVMRLLIRIEQVITDLLEDQQICQLLKTRKAYRGTLPISAYAPTNREPFEGLSVRPRTARAMSI